MASRLRELLVHLDPVQQLRDRTGDPGGRWHGEGVVICPDLVVQTSTRSAPILTEIAAKPSGKHRDTVRQSRSRNKWRQRRRLLRKS